jgi:hypothetical protein
MGNAAGASSWCQPFALLCTSGRRSRRNSWLTEEVGHRISRECPAGGISALQKTGSSMGSDGISRMRTRNKGAAKVASPAVIKFNRQCCYRDRNTTSVYERCPVITDGLIHSRSGPIRTCPARRKSATSRRRRERLEPSTRLVELPIGLRQRRWFVLAAVTSQASARGATPARLHRDRPAYAQRSR